LKRSDTKPTDGKRPSPTTRVVVEERWMAVTREAPLGVLSDPEVFTAFYTQALPRVYGYLLTRCGGAAWLAEDLTQETFLAAVAEIKLGKSVSDPIPWVVRIARNKFVDHVRRNLRDERKLLKVWQAREGSSETQDGRESALNALQCVPLSQRAALSLRYQDGLSVSEVAKALGRSIHATESLLARGKETFRRNYRRDDNG
jgi:RNA polymerase sigma-70 factor, ECF subfamily